MKENKDREVARRPRSQSSTHDGMGFARLLIASVIAVVAISCGDDPPPPITGIVECRGTSCVCPSSGPCQIKCVADCDLQCAGSGECDFECGAGCEAACTGSGPCTVRLGPDSTTACTGSSGCDVTCSGNCTVRCPGSGDCIARCAAASTCKIEQCSGQVIECPSNVRVCGGKCPSFRASPLGASDLSKRHPHR
jgi:hypothetical protein